MGRISSNLTGKDLSCASMPKPEFVGSVVETADMKATDEELAAVTKTSKGWKRFMGKLGGKWRDLGVEAEGALAKEKEELQRAQDEASSAAKQDSIGPELEADKGK
jgi:hypothetical protein